MACMACTLQSEDGEYCLIRPEPNRENKGEDYLMENLDPSTAFVTARGKGAGILACQLLSLGRAMSDTL